MTIAPLRASAAAMNRSFPLPAPMRRALDLAAIAAESGEVPVGAVVTRDGEIVAEARNAMRGQVDPTAHAEMVAIRLAATRLDSPRLDGCELWVTLEPCAMCAAAISLARIGKLNFAAEDPKGGGVLHGARVFAQPTCHHKPEVLSGIGETEAAAQLQAFFAARR
jgi:tRNA(adenine34) deaminase